MNTTKTAIKGIYPLSYLQQTLLIHHLSGDLDQGFLQVKCRLKGPLNDQLFRRCWHQMVELHPVLRTSIHWEQIEKPVMVIHEAAEIPWKHLSWEKESADRQSRLLNEFLKEDQQLGLNLAKAPLTRLTLIEISQSEHILIWTCHHILFDGWTSGLIFSDLFDCYQAEIEGGDYQPEPAPDYKLYWDWLKRQDLETARQFWVEKLSNYTSTALIRNVNPHGKSLDIHQRSLNLTPPQTAGLSDYLRKNRLTISSLSLSLWGILLSKLTDRDEVVFGTTVSGRSSGFSQVERMSGLFMNVIPVAQQLTPNTSFSEIVQSVQDYQLEAGQFDHISQDKIISWLDWPVNQPLFNSLVIVQNLVWQDRQIGDLLITEATGDLTTTYPMTLVVRPGEQLELLLCYDNNQVKQDLVDWVMQNLSKLVELVLEQPEPTVSDLLGRLAPPPGSAKNGTGGVIDSKHAGNVTFPGYQAPTNSLELRLTKIWEEIFDKYPIGINDDFFQIGGQSMMAMRLIHQIEEKMGVKVSPSTLIEYPTIATLVKSWKQKGTSRFSSLVPMRAHGSKPPLFVIHGGGGHVFFYHPLTSHMDPEQPVYALQPLGLDGEEGRHTSIEDMARHYLNVIRQVQPEGSFSLLGTCFSDPVCYEMAQQLYRDEHELNALIIVDSAPKHLFPRDKIRTPIEVRKQRFKERFRTRPAAAIRKMVVDRVRRITRGPKEKIYYLKQKYHPDPRKRNLLSLQENLMHLYYQYRWQPYAGEVTLIQTSQNVQRINNYDDEVWKKLALGGVRLLESPGHHRSRFEEPDVVALAKCLQEYLDSTYD